MNGKRCGQSFIRMALGVALQASLLGPAWCDPDKESHPKPGVKSAGETQWRREYESVKLQRNLLLGAGAGGTIGGLALVIAGRLENEDAKNTPGCYQAGGTIYCNSAKSTKEAQDKIDSSRNKIYAGLGFALGGTALGVWGWFRHMRLDEIEAEGMSRGFRIGLNPRNPEEIQVAYSWTF